VTFGYHALLGWRTHIVRFPLSVLAIEEFEHDENPAYFWGVMTLDILGALAAIAVAAYIGLSNFNWSAEPIHRFQSLNGCYEGQGLPDFMRPPHHWSLRITDNVIIDRDGKDVSKIRLGASRANMTPVTFSPGILIAGKPQTVLVGDTVAGEAYLAGGRITIALADEWGNVMQQTSCD
jgi:hypothetical protein